MIETYLKVVRIKSMLFDLLQNTEYYLIMIQNEMKNANYQLDDTASVELEMRFQLSSQGSYPYFFITTVKDTF